MVIVIFYNWLIKGLLKYVYVLFCVIDIVNLVIGEIVLGFWRDDGIFFKNLLFLVMLRYGNNLFNYVKRVRDEFKEYFNCEGEVGW